MTVTKGDWTPEAMDDLKERLMRKAEHKSEVQHMPESSTLEGKALAYIEALEQHVSELEEALRRADEAMTCRRDDDAHYCPNCDNSLYEARDKIRAALNREPSP
jgi:hypothetical protein